MPQAPKWLIQWLGVGVIVAAGVAVVFVAQRGKPPIVPAISENSGGVSTATSSAASLAAEARYREELQLALKGWNDQSHPADYGALQQRLMDLTVPGRYRAAHLDLVIAAVALRDAQRSPTAAVAASATEAFARVLERFPFIPSDASQ
ncbi:MAG: hypothetical protein Q7S23_01045 [bacterium]|nr:hypothetical protein [bacterium]